MYGIEFLFLVDSLFLIKLEQLYYGFGYHMLQMTHNELSSLYGNNFATKIHILEYYGVVLRAMF